MLDVTDQKYTVPSLRDILSKYMIVFVGVESTQIGHFVQILAKKFEKKQTLHT